MKNSLFSFFLFLSLLSANAQPAPASSAEILKEAHTLAAKENKNVMIIFHASWCGWCHRMDNSMNDEACKKFFDDNYVVRHLVVDESPDKKNLENPGAGDFKIKYQGDGQGIPFWLVFDKEGILLADSKIRQSGEGMDKGDNIGCPATEKEVDSFISILKKTSSLNSQQLEIIRKRFRENDK
jgi:thiol-disulfide isomerase/thioredoxin